MLLYAARGRWTARRKFQPRHFRMLTEAFAPGEVRWTDSLAELPNGGWGLVIHAPGSYALGRSLADRHAGGLFVFGALSREERRALCDRNGVLVVDLDWDPLIPHQEIVAGLIEAIDSQGLDPARIRLVHSNLAARAAFEGHWRGCTGREPLRTLAFPTSFALAVAYHHGRWSEEAMAARLARAHDALHRAEPGKLLASFNGGLRASRIHLVAWMHHAGLLERSHVSLQGYSKAAWRLKRMRSGAPRRPPPPNLQASLDKMPYADEVSPSLREIWRRLPLNLDLKRDFRDHGYEHVVWESPDPHYYDDSRFSVVIESHADRLDMLHLTEKLAKPMLNAHPFLALGSPHAMARLRSYGFESFAPQFNEAFDSWPWPRERFRLLLEELRRIAALPPDDLKQTCSELWPRCEHNFRHLVGGGARRELSQVFRRDVLESLV